MHSSPETTAFASLRPSTRVPSQPTMGSGMPILHVLLSRQEQSLSRVEELTDMLMQKLEAMGAPEMPSPGGVGVQPTSYQGALLAVECVADRIERAAMRLDMILARLAAAV